MTDAPTDKTFEPIRVVAHQLGVEAAWLRGEAIAGRVPHLRAGRRLLANRAAVEQALLARSASATQITTQEVANAR